MREELNKIVYIVLSLFVRIRDLEGRHAKRRLHSEFAAAFTHPHTLSIHNTNR